jgi:hypothetical protein
VAATPLSRIAGDVRKIRAVLRLAWRSLLLGSMVLAASSCIVADPPEYKAPQRTRPLLNVYGAGPTATRALIVYSVPRVATKFSVEVQSEDAGEELRAIFFLDYQLPGEKKLAPKALPPSTYDKTRTITFDWFPEAKDAGCHFLSLVVAHRSSFLIADDEDHLDPKAAEEDAAIVTWTVNIDPKDAGNTLPNCPSRTTTVP